MGGQVAPSALCLCRAMPRGDLRLWNETALRYVAHANFMLIGACYRNAV
jgi:hypothetical protein